MSNRDKCLPMPIRKLIKNTNKYRNRKIQFILSVKSILPNFENLPVIWNCIYGGHIILHHKDYIYVKYPGYVEIHGSTYYKRFVTPGHTIYFEINEIFKSSIKIKL